VELLVGPLQETVLGEKFCFALGRKGDVRGGGLAHIAQRHQPGGERIADLLAIDAIADQKPWSCRRRERNLALQLRVITAACALIGIGPAAVENVFAL